MTRPVHSLRHWAGIGASGFLAIVLAGTRPAPCRAAAAAAGQPAPAVAADRAARNLDLFDRVWDLVNRKYYDQKLHGVDWRAAAALYRPKAAAAEDDETLDKTINAMLALLKDHHTQLWTAGQMRRLLTQKHVFTGMDLLLSADKRWVVREVEPGSPAEAAGVRPGWILLTRNGQPFSPRPASQSDPAEGEVVNCGFLDAHDQPVSLGLRARTIKQEPECRVLPGNAVYLRFRLFDGSNHAWLNRQLREHSHAPAIVVDLRDNPGGRLFLAGEMIGDFFDHSVDYGKVTSRSGRESDIHTFHFLAPRYRGGLAVLVDGASASSAEIFAGIMKARRRAIIVGQRTAGAVLDSEFFSVPGGGKLQLSVEDYALPGGQRLEGTGVEPDVAVPARTVADIRAGRDPDLEAALRALDLPSSAGTPW